MAVLVLSSLSPSHGCRRHRLHHRGMAVVVAALSHATAVIFVARHRCHPPGRCRHKLLSSVFVRRLHRDHRRYRHCLAVVGVGAGVDGLTIGSSLHQWSAPATVLL
ncbi:hypothetical protein EI94DRAFT_1752906, partial [Lactarius quietus]